MKRIRFPLVLFAASALLLGIGAVACGDDDDDGNDGGTATSTGGGTTTLGAYLKDVNDVQEGVSTATDVIGEQSDTAFSDPAKARQSLSAAIDVADSAVTALKALDPPDEAKSEHEALIAAGENLVKVAQKLSDELQGMQPGAAFDTLAKDAQAPGSELSAAIDKMVSACEAMQSVSEEYKTSVSLSCPARNS